MLVVFAALFVGLLLFAAVHDVATMTIPNWLSIGMAVMFLPAAYFAGLSLEQVGYHLLFGGAALIVGAVLFFLKVWGGGDAKLVAATSLWVGFAASGEFLYGIAVAGGVLTFVVILARRLKLKSDMEWASRLLNPKNGAPYAVAIAAGGFLVLSSSPVLGGVF